MKRTIEMSESLTESGKTEETLSAVTRVHERGHIFFFYRPESVELEYSDMIDWWKQDHSVESVNDVSRFYMLLKPDILTSPCAKNRLFTMKEKKMPNASKHDMNGAIVTLVSDNMAHVTSYLGGLKCWDGLDVPPARPCGEGIYEIVRHGLSGPLHFIYQLELPTTLGVAQKEFNIEQSASYILFMKNPDQILDPRHKPILTAAQKNHFRGRNVEWKKLAPLDPSFFDILYSEYIFLGHGISLVDEDLGQGVVAAELESQASAELLSARIRFGCENVENKIFADLDCVNESDLGPKDSIKTGQFA